MKIHDQRTSTAEDTVRAYSVATSGSMPALIRALSFQVYRALGALLGLSPFPIWRAPAALLACIRLLIDPASRRLNCALLHAFGTTASIPARLRLHWSRCYRQEAEMLLLMQAHRLTRAWAADHVDCVGDLPSGGAVLVAPHHAAKRIGELALANMVGKLGKVTAEPRDSLDLSEMGRDVRHYQSRGNVVGRRAYGDRLFQRQEAGRKGLQLLREGGYLVVFADYILYEGPCFPLLGRSVPLPRGAAWFSERSGKPIVPFMIEPVGRRWRLWLGAATPATQAGVATALETCIRRDPASWDKSIAMVWLQAPVYAGGGT